MIQIRGFWWPDDVATKWQHALNHVDWSLTPTLRLCTGRRTAVQAGGNVGLWPRMMAETFQRVVTFEPEPISFSCLLKNVPANVLPAEMALGASVGICGIKRRSLGSHEITAGTNVAVTTVDALGLEDVDLLQLDVEGYEWHALVGATETIARCHPLIHIELRDMASKYGEGNASIRRWLDVHGYKQIATGQGSDAIFRWTAC